MLEQEAQAEAALTQAAREAHKTAGPRRGRLPQPPRSVPPAKAQRNFSDPESRIMPASDAKGSVVQGYNCHAAVDARAQIIVAADVTDEANDKQQAQPMLTQVLAQTGQVPRTVSMDTGYFSELGKSVSFGVKGHAVIVDQTGKVLAHPLTSWEKDMRALFPDVKKGDRLIGVRQPGAGVTFYSGPLKLGQIDDETFAEAFFGIWLNPTTRAPDLRAQLLKLP